MRTATLEGLFLDPSFIIIFFVIIGTIANILIGVSMLPEDKRKKRFKTHRFIFFLIVFFYGVFLWVAHSPGESNLFKYIVLAYLLFIIPLTRRINVTVHAILASLGLILLVGVASFNVL